MKNNVKNIEKTNRYGFGDIIFIALCLALVMVIVAFSTFFFADAAGLLPNSVVSEEYIPVVAVVTEKDYTPNRTTYSTHRSGNVTITQPHVNPADYDVIFMYEGIRGSVDNKELFDAVEIGEEINVFVCNGYNRDGDLVNTTLSYTAK